LDVAIEAIAEGLADRKVDKDKGEDVPATAEKKEDRKPATRKRAPKA
jgi:hypothetical protein